MYLSTELNGRLFAIRTIPLAVKYGNEKFNRFEIKYDRTSGDYIIWMKFSEKNGELKLIAYSDETVIELLKEISDFRYTFNLKLEISNNEYKTIISRVIETKDTGIRQKERDEIIRKYIILLRGLRALPLDSIK